MPQQNYTIVNHTIRKEFGLSLTEYCILDSIYHLATNPLNRTDGWCSATKEYLGEFIGISKQSVHSIITSLINKGLLEKNEATKFLRTTEKWNATMPHLNESKETLPSDSKETLPSVKKVYSKSKETLLDQSKESLLNNNSIDNNIYNNTYSKKASKESTAKVLDDPDLRNTLKNQFPSLDVDTTVEQAKDWLSSTGKKYKDYAAFMRNWLRREEKSSAKREAFTKQEDGLYDQFVLDVNTLTHGRYRGSPLAKSQFIGLVRQGYTDDDFSDAFWHMWDDPFGRRTFSLETFTKQDNFERYLNFKPIRK